MIRINPVLLSCFLFAFLVTGCATQAPQATEPAQPTGPAPVVKTGNIPSYSQIMKYIQTHLTAIVSTSIAGQPANGTRNAQGFGFISPNQFYVDFEDGHYAYTALLDCEYD